VIDTAATLILLALMAVPLAWLLPGAWAMDAVAAWTTLSLAVLAPASACWLVTVAILTPLVLRWGEGRAHRGPIAGTWAGLLLAPFLFARLEPGVLWLGASFFTLRHLHVVAEWWMRRLPTPTVREHVRYQLFLPVLLVGPIHRIDNFNRQCDRRRWDAGAFFAGAERVLFGAAMAFILGTWLIDRAGRDVADALAPAKPFLRLWAISAIDWVKLYCVFAGLSAVALGTALMIGVRLEENFQRPWQARTLLEFWTRWHMSLTRWVQDYVFRPVVALSRNAFLGLLAAMLVVGLWHEFSLYYVLWSFWQALGVLATKLAGRASSFVHVPAPMGAIVGPILVLAWLSAARPVIVGVLGLAR
jgi:alginate O-acetyltransferase complex protein AlgI